MNDSAAADAAPLSRARGSLLVKVLIVALTLLSLTPIWFLPYFPTTDGPSHLETCWILRHWAEAPAVIHSTYELNLDPSPNWASHATLTALMFVVSPGTAERILLTGYVLIWVLAIGYFLRSVHRDGTLYLLLSLPLIHSYLLYMGFYNFVMSVPLAFFLIGYWWRRRARPLDARLVLALNALAIALYFFHLMSVLFALGSILLLAAIRDRFRPKAVLATVAALVPAFALPVHFVVSNWHPPGHVASSSSAWTELFGIALLFSFNRFSLVLGWALAGLIAAIVVVTILRESLARRAGEHGWRLRARPEDGFALLALLFAVGWFLVPDAMAGGSFVRERVGLYPVILILGWLTTRIGRSERIAIAALAAAITVAQVLVPLPKQAAASREVADYTSGITYVRPGETVLPINLFSHVGQPQSRISTLLHAVGYYTLAGGVGMFNYEAATSYFPIRYRPGENPKSRIGDMQCVSADITPWRNPEPIDWVVARFPSRMKKLWPRVLHELPTVRWILTHYVAVHHQGDAWLFRRKPGPWPPPPPPISTPESDAAAR